jgi:hypothetical protein
MTLTEIKSGAVLKLRLDAERLERALHKHTAAERDPGTHAHLHRMARVIGELRTVLATPVPSIKVF